MTTGERGIKVKLLNHYILMEKIRQFLKERQSAVLVFVLAAFLITTLLLLISSRAKKEELVPPSPTPPPAISAICDSSNCATGCCVGSACIEKSDEVGGYFCAGGTKWSSPLGEVLEQTPESVVAAVEEGISQGIIPTVIPPVKPVTLTENQKIAQNIIRWLDTMKNDKGQYFANEKCTLAGSCQKPSTIDKQRGIVVVWSRYRNYKNTKDPRELKLIDSDLATLTTPTIGSPAQNDYLNCTLMYEMYQSNILNQEQKNKIYSICNDSIFYGDDMNNYNKLAEINKPYTKEPQVVEVMRGGSLNTGLTPNPKYMNKYSSYVADLATIYTWTKEPEALAISKYFFNLALQLFSQQTEDLDESLLGLSAIKLYEATGEQKYNDFTKYFFNQKRNSTSCSNLDYCVNYLFFLNNYKDKVENELINQERERVVSELLSKYYGNQKKIFYNLNMNEIYYYPVNQNSMLSGMLSGYSN